MIVAFIYGLVVAAVCGLPTDYARRRIPGVATAAALGSAAAVVGAVVLASTCGWLHGAAAVPALVFGLIAGSLAADAYADRAWGAPQRG